MCYLLQGALLPNEGGVEEYRDLLKKTRPESRSLMGNGMIEDNDMDQDSMNMCYLLPRALVPNEDVLDEYIRTHALPVVGIPQAHPHLAPRQTLTCISIYAVMTYGDSCQLVLDNSTHVHMSTIIDRFVLRTLVIKQHHHRASRRTISDDKFDSA